MAYSSTSRKQGQRGCCPFPLHPKSPPNLPPLRCGQSRLTIPNTSSTITMPASLRSDCCSPSLRNAVRLPSGIDVRLHRNTQSEQELVFHTRNGTPFGDTNLLHKYLKPAGRKLGMPWLSWHTLRRTHATLLQHAGGSLRDAQAQLGHSKLSTTLEIYTIPIPAHQ